jgi:GTP-binding protein
LSNPVLANFFRRAQFVLSAQRATDLPPDTGAEVAFTGRSNAGKSSAINALVDHKGLARTSKTPGRTQLINFFSLDDDRRLVDLPGFGYAKVSAEIQQGWQETLNNYLHQRHTLAGLVLIMDIRHPLTPIDQNVLAWCRDADMPVHILLSKADKLSRGAALAAQAQVAQFLSPFPGTATVQVFSALKKQGVDEARAVVAAWLGMADA